MSLVSALLAVTVMTYADAINRNGRDTFVLCTGSDWLREHEECEKEFRYAAQKYSGSCGWAIYDRKDGLSKDEANALGKLPCEIYGYPAIIYRDSEGKPFMQLEAVTPAMLRTINESMLKWEAIRVRRDEALAKARNMPPGRGRAEALGRALGEWLDPLIDSYSHRSLGAYQRAVKDIVEDIRKNDPGDSMGYAEKYSFWFFDNMKNTVLANAQNGEYKKTAEFLKEKLEKPAFTPYQRQAFRIMEFRNWIHQYDSIKDEKSEEKKAAKRRAMEALDLCVSESPKSTLSNAAKNMKRYYCEPVRLSKMRWLKCDNRPYWATATLPVGEYVKKAGTYRITFKPDAGGTSFRNCALLNAGGATLGQDKGEGNNYTVTIGEPGPGAILQVELRGSGWFDGHGEIKVELD